MATRQWPSISVVMPIRDEAAHLEDAVAAVLAQSYPGSVEVVLALAPSSDATLSVATRLAGQEDRLLLVDNPSGGTAAGLNRAIAASTGEVVARVDGHAELSEGYLRQAVETLQETGADNVGGIQQAIGTTPMQRAVAAAMASTFGVGDARFHIGGEPGPVDTVYLGVFRRSALERVGGFDESLVRNQDYELNWRLRESGGVVWFDPRLKVTYRPRGTLRALADQYYQYGQWKRVVVTRNPRSVRWRQLVPPVTAAVNVAGLLVGILRWRPALLAPVSYLTATLVAAALADASIGTRLRLPAVFVTMHHAWGLGFLRGTTDPARVRTQTVPSR